MDIPRTPLHLRQASLFAALAVTLAGVAACGDAGRSGKAEAAAAQAAEAARIQAEAAAAIGGVLKADAEAATLSDYAARAAAMQAIDLSGCPAEFRAAYTDHATAWSAAGRIQTAIAALNSDDAAAATLAKSFLAGLLETGDRPIVEHIQENARLTRLQADANDTIAATSGVVRRIAAYYGVQPPVAP